MPRVLTRGIFALQRPEARKRLDERRDVGRVRDVPPGFADALPVLVAQRLDAIADAIELAVQVVAAERVAHLALVVQHLFVELAPVLRANADAIRRRPGRAERDVAAHVGHLWAAVDVDLAHEWPQRRVE